MALEPSSKPSNSKATDKAQGRFRGQALASLAERSKRGPRATPLMVSYCTAAFVRAQEGLLRSPSGSERTWNHASALKRTAILMITPCIWPLAVFHGLNRQPLLNYLVADDDSSSRRNDCFKPLVRRLAG